MQWKDIDKQKIGKDDERREGFSRKMDSATEGDVHHIMSSIFLGKNEKKENIGFIKISVYGAKRDDERHGQEFRQEN